MVYGMDYIILGIICLIIGLIPLLGVLRNWKWFWNNRRAQRLTKMIGKKGAQIFYSIIGIGFTGYGIISILVGIFA
jgi:hypothetical protein